MSKITLYKLEANNKAEIVSEKPFKLEREMQKVFEDNLGLIMGLEMVKSEFTIKDKRIDTLAFDNQSNSFVIIEYKRDKNNSVFDQGITYLNLMLNYKADFVLEYNENMKNNLLRDDVDWSQSRQDISRKIKVYSEEDHLKGKSDEIIELYEKFKNAILNLKNDLEVVYRKNYI